MDSLLTDNRPETCLALGLDCATCVRKSAASIVRICHGIESHDTQGIFLQLYPSAGCRPMASAFELACREFLNAAKPALVTVTAAAAAA